MTRVQPIIVAASAIVLLGAGLFATRWYVASSRFEADLQNTREQFSSLVREAEAGQITSVVLNPWECDNSSVMPVPTERWVELAHLLSVARQSDGESGDANTILMVLEVQTPSGLHRLFFTVSPNSPQRVHTSYGQGPILFFGGDEVWEWIKSLPEFARLNGQQVKPVVGLTTR